MLYNSLIFICCIFPIVQVVNTFKLMKYNSLFSGTNRDFQHELFAGPKKGNYGYKKPINELELKKKRQESTRIANNPSNRKAAASKKEEEDEDFFWRCVIEKNTGKTDKLREELGLKDDDMNSLFGKKDKQLEIDNEPIDFQQYNSINVTVSGPSIADIPLLESFDTFKMAYSWSFS